MKVEHTKSWLLLGSCLSALSMGTGAFAQTAQLGTAQDEEASVLEEVIVTGIRGSIISSIAAKRNNDIVSDVISAEDIGKFPDTNLAESLQRITGVQITRDRNEGKFVSVRGLPPEFNLVTLNGHYVANASVDQLTQSSDRRFDFSILSSDFVQALEVFKTSRADLDEGGVSATINVRTLRPLELGRRRIGLNAEVQYGDLADAYSPEFAALFSDTFADGRFGLALGAVYSRRVDQGQSTGTAQLNPITVTAPQIGAGVPLVAGRQYFMADSVDRTFFDQERERNTYSATLQYQASENLRITLEGLYSKYETDQQIGIFISRPFFGIAYSNAPVTDATVDSNGVITRIVTTDTAAEVQGFQRFEENDVTSVSGDAVWDDGINYLRVMAAFSEAGAETNEIGLDNFLWGPLSQSAVSGGYDISSGADVPEILLPGGLPAINGFANNYIGGNVLNRTDESFEAQIDYSRMVELGLITEIKFGAKFGDRDRSNRSTFLQDLSVRLSGAPAVQNLSRFVGASPVNGFLDGYQGSELNFTDFPFIDANIFLQGAYGGSLAAWQAAVRSGSNSAQSVRENLPLTYSVGEETTAAYGQADFGNADETITGNFGVRVIRTKQVVDTFGVNLAGIQPSPVFGAPPVIPSTGPFKVEQSYTDVLPSFNLTWSPLASDDLLVRVGLGKVMSRPNLDSLVPRYSVDTTRTPFVITGGNPELEPYRAWQYDLSVEYYPSEDTLLSAAVFRKDIASFIYTSSRQFTVGNNAFTQILPVNGAGASITGLELAATTVFSALPAPFDGLGVQANATFVDGEIDADLAAGRAARDFEGLSDLTYNLVLFYEKGPLSARAAYNFRSEFLSTADLRGANSQQVQTGDFDTLDLQVSYEVRSNISLWASAMNVLDTPYRQDVSLYTGGTYALSYSEGDRRFAVGVRAAF